MKVQFENIEKDGEIVGSIKFDPLREKNQWTALGKVGSRLKDMASRQDALEEILGTYYADLGYGPAKALKEMNEDYIRIAEEISLTTTGPSV